MVQVSEDIFYQVKKEILDKLDLILQKINLEIINYLHPQEEEFSFIELSSFEYQITHLFHYLDRLYASLNSSVSFSSVNSKNSKCSLDCHAQNQRLLAQNHQLHHILLQLQSQQSDREYPQPPELPSPANLSHSGTFDKQLGSRSSQLNLEQLRDNVRALMGEFKAVGKDVKRMLKKYKFEMLESRVQIISRLKDEECERAKGRASREETKDQEEHLEADGEAILEKINQILSIC